MTFNSLVTATKAGVPSNKLVIGVSSYGRSFKMADANCRTSQCTYLGARNQSPAKPGRCTETGGYISDYEINEIIEQGGAIKTWHDGPTNSDYLVYEGTEWVAYMNNETKTGRMLSYKFLNFGGTTDWAIDLQGEGSGTRSGRPVYLDPSVYETPIARCEPPCILVFPPSSLPTPTTISPPPYTTSLEYGATGETTIDGTRTTAFITSTTTIVVSLPPITVTQMTYSNVNITSGMDQTDLRLVPSITIAPIPVNVPDGVGGTTVRTITPRPWPQTNSGSGGDGPGNPGQSSGLPPLPSDVPPESPSPTPTELPTWTTWPVPVITPIPEGEDPDDDDESGSYETPCDLWFFNICIALGPSRITRIRWVIPPGIRPPGPPPPGIVTSIPGWTLPGPLPRLPPLTFGRDGVVTYPTRRPCETDSASICSTTTTLSITTLPGPTTSTVTRTSTRCETIYGCSLTDWDTEITTRTEVCPLPTPIGRRDIDNEDRKEAHISNTDVREVHEVREISLEVANEPARAPINADAEMETEVVADAEAEGSTTKQDKGKSQADPAAAELEPADSYDAEAEAEPELSRRQLQPSGCPAHAYVYPRLNMIGEGNIPSLLAGYPKAMPVKIGDRLLFYWVPYLHEADMEVLRNSDDVGYAYYYEDHYAKVPSPVQYANFADDHALCADDVGAVNASTPPVSARLAKRAWVVQESDHWQMSQVSLPRKHEWRHPDSRSTNLQQTGLNPYNFWLDDASGADHWIYVVGEKGFWAEHGVSTQFLLTGCG